MEQQKSIKLYHFQAKSQTAFFIQSKFLAKRRPVQYASNHQNVRVTSNAWTKISSLRFSCIQPPKNCQTSSQANTLSSLFLQRLYLPSTRTSIEHNLSCLKSSNYHFSPDTPVFPSTMASQRLLPHDKSDIFFFLSRHEAKYFIFFSWHEACEICWSSNIY